MAQRERERKKKGRRKYGQAKLKHAKRGILSCVLSALVFVLLVILLAVAYYSKGTTAPIVGSIGLIVWVTACWAFYLGWRGFRERDKEYLTCKIGICCSGLFVLGFIIIFCRGLF